MKKPAAKKKRLPLDEWFVKAMHSGRRRYLTVPPHIKELPCGHTREVGGREFAIKWTPKGWIHCGSGCKTILALPEVAMVGDYPGHSETRSGRADQPQETWSYMNR
jgi:hypothetical protein